MLPKAHRSVDKSSIIPTIREGQKKKYGSLSFYLLKVSTPLRVVVIVSKKVSKKAVERNLLRRRIYSIIKDLKVVKDHTGILVIRAFPNSCDIEYQNLRKDIEQYFNR